MPNGDLFVEGTKVVLLNEEEYHLYISGLVRPADIAADVASSEGEEQQLPSEEKKSEEEVGTGAGVAGGGRPMAVFGFTVREGRSAGIELVSDPETLAALELEPVRESESTVYL